MIDYPLGTWYQFFIEKDGIYSISYETLSTFDNISNVDPQSISIFTGTSLGRSITQEFNQDISDNLIEIPIFIDGEEDGTLIITTKSYFMLEDHLVLITI